MIEVSLESLPMESSLGSTGVEDGVFLAEIVWVMLNFS